MASALDVDDVDAVAEELAEAEETEVEVPVESGEAPFCTVVAPEPGSLASVAIRPCNCWRSEASGSLDEPVPLDVVEPESAEPPLDDEPTVVWSCDRTARKPETGEDMPLASTVSLGSDPDVAVPAAAVDDVSAVLVVDNAGEALWARPA